MPQHLLDDDTEHESNVAMPGETKTRRTRESVRTRDGTPHTWLSAAKGVEEALKFLEGRWKLMILFQLFGGKVLRFSELQRAIPSISEKMLSHQLRRLESDGMVRRIPHQQVPPKVEYRLTDWGQSLCPVLDALLRWAAVQDAP